MGGGLRAAAARWRREHCEVAWSVTGGQDPGIGGRGGSQQRPCRDPGPGFRRWACRKENGGLGRFSPRPHWPCGSLRCPARRARPWLSWMGRGPGPESGLCSRGPTPGERARHHAPGPTCSAQPPLGPAGRLYLTRRKKVAAHLTTRRLPGPCQEALTLQPAPGGCLGETDQAPGAVGAAAQPGLAAGAPASARPALPPAREIRSPYSAGAYTPRELCLEDGKARAETSGAGRQGSTSLVLSSVHTEKSSVSSRVRRVGCLHIQKRHSNDPVESVNQPAFPVPSFQQGDAEAAHPGPQEQVGRGSNILQGPENRSPGAEPAQKGPEDAGAAAAGGPGLGGAGSAPTRRSS